MRLTKELRSKLARDRRELKRLLAVSRQMMCARTLFDEAVRSALQGQTDTDYLLRLALTEFRQAEAALRRLDQSSTAPVQQRPKKENQ